VEALLFRARRHLRLQKRSLGILSTAPLPASIASNLGLGGTTAAGGSAGAAGGAAFGADLALKAAALVAVGAMTAGVGYRAIHGQSSPQQPGARASAQARAMQPHKTRLASPTRPHRTTARKGQPSPSQQLRPTLASPSHNVEHISTGTTATLPAAPTTTPVITPPPLPVLLPALPPTPPVQPPTLPVTPPKLPVTPPKLPIPPQITP
jgi:hypothetical protein